MTKKGKLFLFLLLGGAAIEVVGIVLDSLAMILIGGVACVSGAVMPFVGGRKMYAQAVKTHTENLKKINANFSYNPAQKHLTVKKRCPENSEAFGVKDYRRHRYSDVPAKLVYTGATVGGITTGGVHLSGGYTAVANGEKSGRCILLYSWYNGTDVQTDVVETITVSNKNYNKKISKYLCDEKIIVVDDKAKTKMAGALAYMKMDAKSSSTLNMYETAIIDDYPSEEKCLEIISWICGID